MDFNIVGYGWLSLVIDWLSLVIGWLLLVIVVIAWLVIVGYWLLPRAREARTRGRVIGLSRCLFVDTKTSTLIEVGQHMSSTSYV